MRVLPVLSASVALAAVALGPRCAGATECPAPTAALAGVDAETRLRLVTDAFRREVRDTDIWSWSWGSTYVAASAAQGITAALIRDRATRIDLTVGALSAGFGALTLYGLPLRVTLPLVDRAWTREPDLCRRLARAEATLADVADRQRLASSWIPHVGNVLFNVGIGLILGLGYGHWKSAGLSSGIGIVVGEANVLTQPHRLPDVLERYREGRLEERAWTSPAIAVTYDGHALGWSLSF